MAQDRSKLGRGALRVGAWSLAISLALIGLPFLLPASVVNKFLVAIGFLGACASITCLLNAAWDLWRERR